MLPFGNSIMDRGLLWMHCRVEGMEVLFSTSHLESWIQGRDRAREREQQLREVKAFCDEFLRVRPSVAAAIFCGDLNWDDEPTRAKATDKPLLSILGNNWIDAWKTTHAQKDTGYTYDSRLNPMLTGHLRRRFDRFLIFFNHAHKFQGTVMSSSLIGTESIPGITWQKVSRRYYNKPITTKELPLLPSDHYGLTAHLIFKPNDTKPNSMGQRKRKF